MDKPRIQDDLYLYVNKEWLDTAVIPEDKPTTGGFSDLDTEVEKILMNDFKTMAESNKYPNEFLKKAVIIYKKALDVKKRKKDGIKPVLKTLKKIDSLKDIKALNRNLKEFVLNEYPLPFELSVQPDMKNTDKYLMYVQGPSTILPDTTYYKEEMKAQKEQILPLWTGMVKQVLAYTKLEEKDIDLYIKDALAFDELISKIVKSSEEWSEYAKCYNVIPFRKFKSSVKPLNVKKLFIDLYGKEVETLSIADPRFLKEFKSMFNEETFVLYKHWAYIKALLSTTSILSEDLRILGSSYRRALSGVAKAPVTEKFAYKLAGEYFSEPVGLYYGEKYFGEEAKKDVISMVKEIIETYKLRINKNTFLQEETKKLAIKKLSTIKIKMGYPDKVEDIYSKLVFNEEDNLFNIVTTLDRIKTEDHFNKLFKEKDHTHWEMPGHMVNACYDPFSNDITFPAAILQAPFYSIKQTRSQNLGGIGAVIAHEISHAFDNNGALFDEKGNLNNWWTKEDLKQFKNKTKAMVKEFEGIELPWGKVNANLIVSENIADNGGMAVTLEIMSSMKDKNYEEYFTNWAKVWCMKAKDEYLKLILNIDVHAPAILRANMQPRNFDEWYQTFNVTKKDKMYIAPNKRVVIW